MPHLSKQKLSKETYQKISAQFADLLTKLITTSDSREIIRELLTPTERVMLSKRLAAIILAHKGESGYRIWSQLKLSPSTAEKILERYKDGKYQKIISKLPKEGFETAFISFLHTALSSGIHAKVGRGRNRYQKRVAPVRNRSLE